MHRTRFGGLLAAVIVTTMAAPPANAAGETVTVDLSTTMGAPQYLASGTLYGMTENGTNPPDHFYRDIKWHFERAGGPSWTGGWLGRRQVRPPLERHPRPGATDRLARRRCGPAPTDASAPPSRTRSSSVRARRTNRRPAVVGGRPSSTTPRATTFCRTSTAGTTNPVIR